jgi:BioD-like phosphotransacetylase family protein
MPRILTVTSEPNAGANTIAAGLARVLGDPSIEIAPTPPGDIRETLAANPGVRAIVVATPASDPGEIANLVQHEGPVSGVILNRVSAHLKERVLGAFNSLGVNPLAVVPEDRFLASPTIGQFAAAIEADGEFLEGNHDRPLDRPVIASIAADPGQAYYTRTEATAIIVRSDKPDLQLSALNAGASCLIVTGGLPVLSYVVDRVRDDEIPLLRTTKDTKETVAALEELFGSAPFTGEPKTQRIASLLAELDRGALLERAATA